MVELDAPTSLVGLASSEVLGVLVSAVWEGVGEGEKVVVSLKVGMSDDILTRTDPGDLKEGERGHLVVRDKDQSQRFKWRYWHGSRVSIIFTPPIQSGDWRKAARCRAWVLEVSNFKATSKTQESEALRRAYTPGNPKWSMLCTSSSSMKTIFEL